MKRFIKKKKTYKKHHKRRRTYNGNTKKKSKKNTKYQNNIWNKWKERIIEFPRRKHYTLDELDAIPYVDERGKQIDIKHEREEQYVSHDYISPHNTVLELGARYGVVSCVINHKLEHPTHHVCLEPDTTVIESLVKNRASHRAHFRIVNGIISNKKNIALKPNGYASRVVSMSEGEQALPTYTVQQIEKQYKLKFDTLVADCEGCLCDFIHENHHFVTHQLNNIMFEADLPHLCDYQNVRKCLDQAGFKVIVDGFVSFWRKEKKLL